MTTRRTRRRKKLILLIGLVALLGVGAIGAVELRKVREASLVISRRARGFEASSSGEHEQAIRDLGYVISKRPADGEASLAFAESRREVVAPNRRHLAQASLAARMAADAMPTDLRPRILLMSLYSEMGLLTERLDAARDILALDPTHRDALLFEIDSLRRLGRRDEAHARSQSFYAAYPEDPDAVRSVIDSMLILSRPEAELFDFITTATASSPTNVRMLLLKARALGQIRRTTEAREAALAASKLPQPDANTLAETVQLLDVLGEAKAVDQLLNQATGGEAALDMATVVAASRAWKDARPQAALDRITGALSDPETASDALLGWAAVIDQNGELGRRAEEELSGRMTPEARGWMATLDARRDIQNRRWSDAAAAAQRALDLDPRSELAMFLLGETDRALGDWRATVDRWRIVKMREPRWLTLRMDLVGALVSAGRPREAVAEAFEALQTWPDRMVMAQSAGRAGVVLLESGETTAPEQRQILELLRAIREQASEAAIPAALLTRALAVTGDLAGAREQLDSILKLEALPPPADLAPLLESCRRYGVFGVQELAARASESSVNDPAVLRAVAMLSAEDGRLRDGIALFDAAIERAASDPLKLRALQRAKAQHLDAVGDPGALEALLAVGASDRGDPENQLAILNSRAAWTNRPAVSSAIGALRAIAGEDSLAWKVFQARETLTFEPTEKAAAQIVTSLESVVQRVPEHTMALSLLGEAYTILKDYSRAADSFGRAVDTQPGNLSLLVRHTELLQLDGRRVEAEVRLREFLRYQTLSASERRLRAQLLLRQGMNAEAQRDLETLAQDGAITDLVLAAQAAAHSGDTVKAKSQFQTILTRDDRTPASVVASADFLARQEGFAAGLTALSHLPESTNPVDRRLIVAGFHRRHGKITEALAMYAAIAEEADRVEAWAAIGQLRLRQGDLEGARDAVMSGLKTHPNDQQLELLQVATQALGTGSVVEGLRRMVDLLEESNVQREPLEQYISTKSAIEARPDDPDFAIARLRAFTDQYPLFFPVWRDLVEALSVGGRGGEAATVAREAAYRLSADARAAELAARALAVSGRFEEALPLAQEWSVRLNDDPYPAEVFTASLFVRLGRFGEAIKRFEPWRERILDEASSAQDIAEAYAGSLAQQGRTDEAGRLLEPLIASDPSWSIRRLRLVSWLRAQPDASREWLDRWGGSVPDTPEGRAAIGQTQYDVATVTGDLALLHQAMETLRALLDDPTQKFLAATLLAAAHEQLGELEQAERHYRLALDVNSEPAVVLNNLAYVLVRMGDTSGEAVELASRAVATAEREPTPAPIFLNYLDTLAEALLKAGRPDEAASAYARIVRVDPENVTALLGHAESLLAGSTPADAKPSIDRLIELRRLGRITDTDQRRRLTDILDRSDRAGG